jgi:hypothetical protein
VEGEGPFLISVKQDPAPAALAYVTGAGGGGGGWSVYYESGRHGDRRDEDRS